MLKTEQLSTESIHCVTPIGAPVASDPFEVQIKVFKLQAEQNLVVVLKTEQEGTEFTHCVTPIGAPVASDPFEVQIKVFKLQAEQNLVVVLKTEQEGTEFTHYVTPNGCVEAIIEPSEVYINVFPALQDTHYY